MKNPDISWVFLSGIELQFHILFSTLEHHFVVVCHCVPFAQVVSGTAKSDFSITKIAKDQNSARPLSAYEKRLEAQKAEEDELRKGPRQGGFLAKMHSEGACALEGLSM